MVILSHYTEVSQFARIVLTHEYVCRLDVSMNRTLLMEELQAEQYLLSVLRNQLLIVEQGLGLDYLPECP